MTSQPGQQPRRRPSLLAFDETRFPLPTRSSTLTSLIRSRTLQNAPSSSYPPSSWRSVGSAEDEEAGLALSRPGTLDADSGVGKLLGDERRLGQILQGPLARSMNLIGKSNPRYRWDRYWKDEAELKTMKRPIRAYYERTNELIEQYMYIDCLLDSSIPHDLLNEYSEELDASAFRPSGVPDTVPEDHSESPVQSQEQHANHSGTASYGSVSPAGGTNGDSPVSAAAKHKHTPRDIFRRSESMPLLQDADDAVDGENADDRAEVSGPSPEDYAGPKPNLPWLEDAEVDSDDPIVTLAIWVNMVANIILLAGKIVVVASVPSMSVLASLVDAVLDFLSTAIIWTTTRLISAGQKDQSRYPVGRRRLEPVGVLVFSIIMITCFAQVALQSLQTLFGSNRDILQLGIPAIVIMVCTIVIKGAVWLWCRMVKNSSVRALASDAVTDVIFNTGSILFPIVGYYARIWWLDALGGLLLSVVVIVNWSQTSAEHVRNLTGFSAQPDERNLLLYLTMRFATAIRQIQNLRAYHAGDKLFVEADIVLSASTPLKDSHDLSEVLTYFLESVPIVERAFVHVDYASYNAPTHMQKQSST